MKKITIFFFILILGVVISGCAINTYEEYTQYRAKANSICDERDGHLVTVGKTLNPNDNELRWESICFKSDEQHFYYDLLSE